MRKINISTGIIGVTVFALATTLVGTNANAATHAATDPVTAGSAFAGVSHGPNYVQPGSPLHGVNGVPAPNKAGVIYLTQDTVTQQLATNAPRTSGMSSIDDVFGAGAAQFDSTVSFDKDFSFTYTTASTNVPFGQGDGLAFIPAADGPYTPSMTSNNGGAGIAGYKNALSIYHQANPVNNIAAKHNGAWLGSTSVNNGYTSLRYTDSKGNLVPATRGDFTQTSANGAQANWANAASGASWDDEYNPDYVPVTYTVKYSAETGKLTVNQSNGVYGIGLNGNSLIESGIIGTVVSGYNANVAAGTIGATTGGAIGGAIGSAIDFAGTMAITAASLLGSVTTVFLVPYLIAMIGVTAWSLGPGSVTTAGLAALMAKAGALASAHGGMLGLSVLLKEMAGASPESNDLSVTGGFPNVNQSVFGTAVASSLIKPGEATNHAVAGTPSDTVLSTTIPAELRGDTYTIALTAGKGGTSSGLGASTVATVVNSYNFGD